MNLEEQYDSIDLTGGSLSVEKLLSLLHDICKKVDELEERLDDANF